MYTGNWPRCGLECHLSKHSESSSKRQVTSNQYLHLRLKEISLLSQWLIVITGWSVASTLIVLWSRIWWEVDYTSSKRSMAFGFLHKFFGTYQAWHSFHGFRRSSWRCGVLVTFPYKKAILFYGHFRELFRSENPYSIVCGSTAPKTAPRLFRSPLQITSYHTNSLSKRQTHGWLCYDSHCSCWSDNSYTSIECYMWFRA